MASVYENNKSELCMLLDENNYVKITTGDNNKWLKVINKKGKLRVQSIKEKTLIKNKKI